MSVEQRVESAIKRAVYYRNYRRARERALTKLSQLYPETYQQLFQIERSIDEQEGKNWLDISGNTRMVISTSTSHGELTGAQTDSKENYDGGKA
jgi:hypothetical protein